MEMKMVGALSESCAETRVVMQELSEDFFLHFPDLEIRLKKKFRKCNEIKLKKKLRKCDEKKLKNVRGLRTDMGCNAGAVWRFFLTFENCLKIFSYIFLIWR